VVVQRRFWIADSIHSIVMHSQCRQKVHSGKAERLTLDCQAAAEHEALQPHQRLQLLQPLLVELQAASKVEHAQAGDLGDGGQAGVCEPHAALQAERLQATQPADVGDACMGRTMDWRSMGWMPWCQ
jgi:hypothetical protein